VLRRARATGQPLPAESAPLFGDAGERAARGREK
ncbi:CoA ester lyase, partial [Burkholderia pseudomallei]